MSCQHSAKQPAECNFNSCKFLLTWQCEK